MTLTRNSAFAMIACVAMFGLNSSADAQLLVYEGFEYTDGQAVAGLNGGIGFNAPWTNQTGGANATIAAGSLASTGGAAALPTSGNSFAIQGDGGSTRVFRTLDLTGALAPFVSGGQVGLDGTTIYMSFLLQNPPVGIFEDPPVLSQTNQFEVGRGNLGSNPLVAFTAGIDTQNVPQQRAIGNKNQTPTDATVNIGDTNTDPDLIVLRIDYAAGNDTMSVFLNPTDAVTEPLTPTGSMMGDFSFNRIGFGAFQNSLTASYDEFRISADYSGAFAPPPVETVTGDADNDGDVDLQDFVAIRDNFFSTVSLGGLGDTVGAFDGGVNLADYVVWKREFEALNGSGSAPGIFGPVPEPSAGVIVLLSCLGLAGFTRRKTA